MRDGWTYRKLHFLLNLAYIFALYMLVYTITLVKNSLSTSCTLLKLLAGICTHLFQTRATVRHWFTSFKVKIQLVHYCMGYESNVAAHKFIWTKSWLQQKYQGWARVRKVVKIILKFKICWAVTNLWNSCEYTRAHFNTLHYIIPNNGILKSNCSIFPWSEGYITQYTP